MLAMNNAPMRGWWVRTQPLGWLVFLLALLMAMPQGHAAQEDTPANVGRTLLQLPVPPGFVDASRPLPQMRLIGERMTPPSNRLLGIFISEQDLALAQGGQAPEMARYFMAQTLRQAEESRITEAEFLDVRQLVRQQQKILQTRITSQTQDHLDKSARDADRSAGGDAVSLKVGDLKGMEVFDDQATSISVQVVTSYGVQAGGPTQEIPMAMGISTALLRGKLVYFYAYAVYRSPADLDWVRAVTRAWLPRAQASNPP